jgi:hypothetical protein
MMRTGNPAVLGITPLDRWLCVTIFRLVCPFFSSNQSALADILVALNEDPVRDNSNLFMEKTLSKKRDSAYVKQVKTCVTQL